MVSSLLGFQFGHGDFQTLPHQSSFFMDFLKKEFIWITHEGWKNCDQYWAMLPKLTQKDFVKSHETH
jgi:hypothetical protein